MNLLKLILLIAFVGSHRGYTQTSVHDDVNVEILQILSEHQVPGAGVALISKDSVVWQGTLGHADRANNVPVTPNTLFGIGSIAKTFLSVAALVAQEKGMLTLDDPIEQIAPTLPVANQWRDTDPVRLIHLLEHTAGFDEAPFHLATRADAHTPLEELLHISKSALVTRWRPGDYYAYNNLGAIVAAHTIEKAIGLPFSDFVRDRVLLPLGMTRATYHPDEAVSPYFSKGYTGANYHEVPFPSLPQWPAGSLVASVEDISTLVQTLLNHGRFGEQQILTRSSVRTMETPETGIKARQGVRYGYGKGLTARSEKGYLFYGHDGRYGGFLSEFGYSRALGVGYVILINNVDGRKAMRDIRQVLLNRMIPDLKLEAKLASSVEAKVPVDVTGCYQPIAPSMDIAQFIMRLVDLQFVVEADGQLYQKSILGDRQPLLPAGDNRFRKPGEPMATSVFVRDASGTWLWLDEATYQRIPMWGGYVQFYAAATCLITMLLSFVILLIGLPIRLYQKKTHLSPQWLSFLAISTFIGMIISFFVLSDSLSTFKPGAVMFFSFGWAFLFLSLVSLFQSLKSIYRKHTVSLWVKYPTLAASLACCATALYLWHWKIVGLALWSY